MLAKAPRKTPRTTSAIAAHTLSGVPKARIEAQQKKIRDELRRQNAEKESRSSRRRQDGDSSVSTLSTSEVAMKTPTTRVLTDSANEETSKPRGKLAAARDKTAG